jgi:type III restriction enzyme
MKLKFKNQDFQTDAVNAVVDLFVGQEKNQATFSLAQGNTLTLFNDFGMGNAMLIDDIHLTANMHEIQKRNRLPLTESNGTPQFSVEMETGTGKTYVYTKTIFELNKQYGFTKFIIVVPSVAIREGVYKSFQITAEHFGSYYDNVPCRYFIYDSAKLSDVRQFAASGNIEIMIINIDAFKKSENIINQVQDKLNGETAMRYIQDTNPIVIIDEPQSVDNTLKAKEAIASLNPMCVLRYSATHRDKINLLYRLTPVDAYQMGLVKQICVSSNRAENDFNKPYVRLVSVSNTNGFSAKLEIDAENADKKVVRKTITVKAGADLFILTGARELYDGYIIEGIDCTPGTECVEFSNTEIVRLGKAIGSVDEILIKRAQIRRTIETHLDKELRYRNQGIKVLSLFFIDEVAKYRTIDGKKGSYAQMFEECYNELIVRPKYADLQGLFSDDVCKAHDGYFSQDKKGILKNTRGDTAADYDTYNTIMKDKEWLLSFDCPLRFVFSHSALKEGWDNPNVFQVCTLIDQKSTFTCRQKIGRGLRLCVDQEGNRIEDRDINVLHVMANESFSEFADTLQKEIEQETDVKFGVLQLSMLIGTFYEEAKTVEKAITNEQAVKVVEALKTAGALDETGKIALSPAQIELPPELEGVQEVIVAVAQKADPITVETITDTIYTTTVTEEKCISYEEAAEVMRTLEKDNLITKDGKIKDTLKAQFEAGTLDLGARFSQAAQKAIIQQIEKSDTRPPIRDASRDVVVRLNKQVMLSPEFHELWGKIKQKTTYRVRIDTDELIKRASKALSEIDNLVGARIVSETGVVNIDNPGVAVTGMGTRIENIENSYSILPDILNVIGETTRAKRSTVYDIINRSGRLDDFICNPQLFIEQATEIIINERHKQAIDGIRYIKLNGQEYYAQELFDTQELLANLDRNAVAVKNSIYDYIVYQSGGIEKPFALEMDRDPDVKMFFKLPNKFKIETPIGTYNPDWAVYLDREGEEKLYFVLETKGSTNDLDLRGRERLKIRCGKEHFKALENEVEMRVAIDWNSAKERF